jgi:hypothetical protein
MFGILVLIATRPGGNLDGGTDNNQAACVSNLFNTLKTRRIWTQQPDLKNEIDSDLARLTFPLLAQPPCNRRTSGPGRSISV